jgi:hypothetical protein
MRWLSRRPKIPFTDPIVGGVYSVRNERGGFGLIKVLMVDEKAVHIRLYSNQSKERLTQLPAEFEIVGLGPDFDMAKPPGQRGSIPENFGIGHLPLSRKAFAKWQPEFIATVEIGPDELEGYEMWRDADGGVFG